MIERRSNWKVIEKEIHERENSGEASRIPTRELGVCAPEILAQKNVGM